MNAQHRVRIVERHERRDSSPEVTALCAVPAVSQALHEAMPEVGRVPARHSGPVRALGESVARQRRDDYVITGASYAMRGRVGQKRH
jgi:hypothetical protein